MEFNEFKKQCGYRSSQNDDNGEEVLNFCNHKRNPDNLEGNCNIENCKEIKMKYNIEDIRKWILYGVNRSWSPQVIKDTSFKSFKLNIRLGYIMRFYTSP